MSSWTDLRLVLAQLRDENPCPLVMYPSPGHSGKPPLRIRLAPWAARTAAELHRRFGDYVELSVGTLPYPPGRRQHRPHVSMLPTDLLSPGQASAKLDGPAVVQSGHTLRHGLLLRNHTDHELRIATNGQVTAVVVDPGTGEVVGGFSGAQQLPLVIVQIAPGDTQRIPLLIGTASFVPDLGYAVPAGTWAIQAALDLQSGTSRLTPPLPLTITSLQALPTAAHTDSGTGVVLGNAHRAMESR